MIVSNRLRFVLTIALVLVLITLPSCVSKKNYENVMQQLSDAESTIVEQLTQITEISSELDIANESLNAERDNSAELTESLELSRTELADVQEQLQAKAESLELSLAEIADLQEQLKAISETPFGLYYIVDTPAGQQLWNYYDDTSEVLVNGYLLVRNYDNISPRGGGNWLGLNAVTPKGVELDRDILDSLINGAGLSSKEILVGYQEILENDSSWAANNYGSIVSHQISCDWVDGLGWVSKAPVLILNPPPQVNYLFCEITARWIPARFEELGESIQVMTLALDPALMVLARECAIEDGIDFETWLIDAILAKLD